MPPNRDVARGAQWIELDAPEGHKLLAAVFRPPGPGLSPVVVILHSGGGFEARGLGQANPFVAAGFMVVAGCWFAGSDPWTYQFKQYKGTESPLIDCPHAPAYAGVNLDSVKYAEALVKVARVLPGSDGQHVGVLGASSGGTAALLLASNGAGVQAVVADSAEYRGNANGERFGQPFKQTAAISLVQNVAPPLLVFHGTADEIVSVQLAREYDVALSQRKVLYEVRYYEGSPHVVLAGGNPYRPDAVGRSIAFFKEYLTP